MSLAPFLNNALVWLLMCPVKQYVFFSFFFFFFFLLFELYPWHMEDPRLGVESELQLPAYTTATATWVPSLICNLLHSSRQHQILNPLSKARDQTHILMDTGQVLNPVNHNGNSLFLSIPIGIIYLFVRKEFFYCIPPVSYLRPEIKTSCKPLTNPHGWRIGTRKGR